MKVNAITLRAGNVIEYNGRLCAVVKNDVVQPGKGNSVAQVELRDLRTGSKDNVRYRTQESVERLRLDQENYQYLFNDGDEIYTFMHNQNYEQIEVSAAILGDASVYLQEGMNVEIESYEGEALAVRLPAQVTCEIVEAEPSIKGQTATTSYKPAFIENGTKVMVPPFIEAGTRVIIRTQDGTYVERAKD